MHIPRTAGRRQSRRCPRAADVVDAIMRGTLKEATPLVLSKRLQENPQLGVRDVLPEVSSRRHLIKALTGHIDPQSAGAICFDRIKFLSMICSN